MTMTMTMMESLKATDKPTIPESEMIFSSAKLFVLGYCNNSATLFVLEYSNNSASLFVLGYSDNSANLFVLGYLLHIWLGAFIPNNSSPLHNACLDTWHKASLASLKPGSAPSTLHEL